MFIFLKFFFSLKNIKCIFDMQFFCQQLKSWINLWCKYIDILFKPVKLLENKDFFCKKIKVWAKISFYDALKLRPFGLWINYTWISVQNKSTINLNHDAHLSVPFHKNVQQLWHLIFTSVTNFTFELPPPNTYSMFWCTKIFHLKSTYGIIRFLVTKPHRYYRQIK